MVCPKCGTQNPDGGAFCTNCGTPLQTAAPQQAPPQQYNAPPAQYNAPQQQYNAPAQYNAGYQTQVMAPKKANYKVIGIAAIAVVVVIAVIIVLLMVKGGGGGKNPLIGVWEFTDSGATMTLTFKTNGTVESDIDGDVSSVDYKVDGDQIIVTDEDGYESTATFKIVKEGGKTALELTIEGETNTLYKK